MSKLLRGAGAVWEEARKIEDSEQFYTKENNKINEKVIEKIKKQTSQFFLLVFIDDLCFLY